VSAEAVMPRRRSWPRLPWLLLALSVVLNIFFIGGAFWVRMETRGPMAAIERFEHVARQLSLDGDQRAAFDHFIRLMRMRTRLMHETNRPLIDRAWTELAKPQPDDAVLNQIFTEAAENRRAYQVDISKAFRAFLAVLSDDQRKEFVELARRRQDPKIPPILRQLTP